MYMEIIQIRSVTVKFRYRDRTFLLDPWLEDKGTGFSANAVLPEMQGLRCPLNDLPCSPQEILTVKTLKSSETWALKM